MSTFTPPNEAAPAAAATVPTDLVWRLSVAQYHEMIAAGILTEDDPVELLEGLLVPKMPKNPAHSMATVALTRILSALAPSDWHVRVQEPITLQDSEPEPDVAVVRGDPSRYQQHHPQPPDVALVVEVADASLRRDRTSKRQIYAQAGIPVYWIVNLAERRLEVHADPSGPGERSDYATYREYTLSEEVPVRIDGREVGRVRVREVVPSASVSG